VSEAIQAAMRERGIRTRSPPRVRRPARRYRNFDGEIESRGYGVGDCGVRLGPLTVGMPEVQTTGSMNN
jgi:hypothetical protein